MGHGIGYIRVRSRDQPPTRQLDQVPVNRVFTDYASGKVGRPQLAQLQAFVRPGNTVVVHP
jgi:DNA invertase Pin-like site-specific DNA recombinase